MIFGFLIVMVFYLIVTYVKTEVFYQVALPYGQKVAVQWADHHQQNGGIDRFKKVDYLFNEILSREPELNEKKKCFGDFQFSVNGLFSRVRKLLV